MAEYPLDAAKSVKHTKENKKTAGELPIGRAAKGPRAAAAQMMYGPGSGYSKASAEKDIKAGRSTTVSKTPYRKTMDKPGWDK